jgi:hypothetical protein
MILHLLALGWVVLLLSELPVRVVGALARSWPIRGAALIASAPWGVGSGVLTVVLLLRVLLGTVLLWLVLSWLTHSDRNEWTLQASIAVEALGAFAAVVAIAAALRQLRPPELELDAPQGEFHFGTDGRSAPVGGLVLLNRGPGTVQVLRVTVTASLTTDDVFADGRIHANSSELGIRSIEPEYVLETMVDTFESVRAAVGGWDGQFVLSDARWKQEPEHERMSGWRLYIDEPFIVLEGQRMVLPRTALTEEAISEARSLSLIRIPAESEFPSPEYRVAKWRRRYTVTTSHGQFTSITYNTLSFDDERG